ncbi:hypothetical protein ACIP4Y_35660 [Streptomyces sp. NPDC088810]|uniref:hypothetical protein n=1 Tax=Streptomyces sp. NPDC088810 TaxID=3365904 RepID=UPI0038295B53
MLPLVPYLPPIARASATCVCGATRWVVEEVMCPPCRGKAVERHGDRLTHLLADISYNHRGVHLAWSDACADPGAFNPHVVFTAPDVTDPHRKQIQLRWFHYWADDMLVAACAAGAGDEEVLALAVAQAHYAIATLAVHEVGEWFTFRGEQVFPPHRCDPGLPNDEENGPDGNGAVVLWLRYGREATAHPPAASTAIRDHAAYLADITTLPGQKPRADTAGITVEGPGDAPATHFAWADATTAEATDDRSRILHAVHQAIVASELTVVARHLLVGGQPVLAPSPPPASRGVPWQAHLTYDG